MTDTTNQADTSVPFPQWGHVFNSAHGVVATADGAVPNWYQSADRVQSGLSCRFSGDWAVIPAVDDARRRALTVKRIMDIVLASLALIALFPLLIATAIAVKLTSKGPVLFRQSRPGLQGRPFEMLKFRTMYVDAGDLSGVRQTSVNDSRVTPLGRFLRAKSIDELPQLINVLKGDMSIIGPRPHVEGMLAGGVLYEELVPYYNLRYEVRPGLSGWAQANGLRGPTTDPALARARIDHDIAYIQNFSILLDLRIILLTLAGEFFTGSGV
jgi:lipopolysaccharide/colanic/teichoic acid biosynthesis glycosyltransferase